MDNARSKELEVLQAFFNLRLEEEKRKPVETTEAERKEKMRVELARMRQAASTRTGSERIPDNLDEDKMFELLEYIDSKSVFTCSAPPNYEKLYSEFMEKRKTIFGSSKGSIKAIGRKRYT